MARVKISRKYVVDSSIAVLGSVSAQKFSPQDQALAVSCAAFLSRAAFHGAELHVPNVFFSEVMSIVYLDFVHSGVLSVHSGKRLIDAIFGTTWEYHFPVWETVFDLQHALGYFQNTNIAEFLAVAEDQNYTFITTDAQLVLDARAAQLKSNILLVSDHPWAQSGGVDEFPIGS